MAKPAHTHIVYLNNNIDQKIWSLYAPFCTEIRHKDSDKKHFAMLCSNLNFTAPFYLQVTAHFKQDTHIELKFPHSLVLLIQEVSSADKTPIGFAPEVAQ